MVAMAFVRTLPASELPPGALREWREGECVVALCNVEGTVHAMDGVCPHARGPLGHGALNGAMVACPWHCWEFDCRTGGLDFNPSVRLPVFAVKVEDGHIWVDLA